MPSSFHYQISDIIELILFIKPKSVLDIGVGFGKYGVLSREYLEVFDGESKYNDFKLVIDGIEIFEKYLTKLHEYIYNTIYIGNALDVLPKIDKKYDLILMIDVIEHFSYEDGLRLIQAALEKSRYIIISTPREWMDQGAVFGNEHETHLSIWKAEDFKKLGEAHVMHDKYSLICVYGKDINKKFHDRQITVMHDWSMLKINALS